MARRGVFKIINLRTGKVYVGSSNTNIDDLIYGYWQNLYSGNHHNYELQEDFNYYGKSNFTVEIVGICYSEDEVRSLRGHEIYINRHNTYNEDVPVHYSGGNPGASFGGYHEPRNNIIDDLMGIIDKSNLSNSYKDKLKSSVRTGNLNSEEQLNTKINYYKNESSLLDILENSNLKEEDKYKIKYKIIIGDIGDSALLHKEINFYRNVYKLIDILRKSDLEPKDIKAVESEIMDGNISDDIQLRTKIDLYHQAYELIDVLMKTNIKSSYKNLLIKEIKKGNITSINKLNVEISVYETFSKYDKATIIKLAQQYCSLSQYVKWNQVNDKIVFIGNSPRKLIPIHSLQKEINLLKQEILNSKMYVSKLKCSAEELAKIICDLFNFESYDLIGRDVLIFDNKYKLSFTKMQKLYNTLDLTIDNKFKINEPIINNYLNKIINADNFKKTLESIIIEYCEIKKIAFWDFINKDTVLLYEDNLNLISIDEIIKFLNPKYKEFNLKLGVLDLKNMYNVFRRFTNKSSEVKADSADRLLDILSKSNLTIDTKLQVKQDINKGKIKTKYALNNKINQLIKLKYKTSRRNIQRR